MSLIDWIVLCATLLAIITYGVIKGKSTPNLEGYFLSGRKMSWGLILLSIMGTQASAITFLAAPGQAYTDGMRFVQYYFGLPLAMIFISIFFLPIFHKYKLYTPYEFLQTRFDAKSRSLTALLFLLQRGLSTGISIFAPSLILSSLLGWNIYITNILMGGLLIIYTLSGGAKAVAYTQRLQFIIIFLGLFLAGYLIVHMMPEQVGLVKALDISGKMGKLNVITTGFKNGSFTWNDQYNLLSGLIGGFFLALSYFGTDQSQVGRYLTASSITESRMGLLLNGIFKIPMQFFILLIGALLFTFYQFNKPPIFFNEVQLKKVENSVYKDSLAYLQPAYDSMVTQKTVLVNKYAAYNEGHNEKEKEQTLQAIKKYQTSADSLRNKVKSWIGSSTINGDSNDTNYIFLRFVFDHLPQGLIGLLIAIIFLASWGSIAAAINSLASCTVIDIYKPFLKTNLSDKKAFFISRLITMAWGLFCIAVAMFAYNIGNSLIEAVNILGSLFYGVILGVFLVALFMKKIKSGHIVFIAALLAELVVLIVFYLSKKQIISLGFLWLNPIGALGVMLFSQLLFLFKKQIGGQAKIS